MIIKNSTSSTILVNLGEILANNLSPMDELEVLIPSNIVVFILPSCIVNKLSLRALAVKYLAYLEWGYLCLALFYQILPPNLS